VSIKPFGHFSLPFFSFLFFSIIIFSIDRNESISRVLIVKHLYDLKILRWPCTFCHQIYYNGKNVQFINLFSKVKKTSQLELQATGFRKGIVRDSTSVRLKRFDQRVVFGGSWLKIVVIKNVDWFPMWQMIEEGLEVVMNARKCQLGIWERYLLLKLVSLK
jgi:hypothetical protein